MNKPKFKIISIVGARPNFIKAAPVSKALSYDGNFEEVIVHTGQHYDHNLSKSFFEELDIPYPKYNLGIGSGRQGWQLGEMIAKLDEVILIENPDAIIIFGDTNSTAAGAIAGAKNYTTVAHVEAGLREYNKAIPEEINKLLITAVTDLYFCPTPTGVNNLKKIGITENVHMVGDVGIDLVVSKLNSINNNNLLFEQLNINKSAYYFVTCHRASNTENIDNLKEILEAIKKMELPVVFPIHPRTANTIKINNLTSPVNWPHVRLLPPISFTDTQTLIRHAKAVITDSGGILKEAYFHRTPGLIIDKQIEWVETVEEGWNSIVGPDKNIIHQTLASLAIPQFHSNCLGNGTASEKIIKLLHAYLIKNRKKELAIASD